MRRCRGGDVHLITSRAQDGPLIVIAEQAVRGPLHMRHVIRMGADAALQSEHCLDEQRALHQTLVEEVFQIVEMRGVVAFELEPRAVARTTRQDVLDLAERVAKDDILVAEIAALPLVLQILEAIEQAEQAEIHRAIQRSKFRLEGGGRLHPLLDGHGRRAAGVTTGLLASGGREY